MANESLHDAQRNPNDEFYTLYDDIQKEVNSYLELDKDAFRGKTILLPCDDPEWSNFTKFFAVNFDALGLKKLISTSLAPDAKPKISFNEPTIWEMGFDHYDEQMSKSKGKIFTLSKDNNGDKAINIEDLEWSYLDEDGDYRSQEITKLRAEADIIVTNPPFSLFQDFLGWIVEANKQFLILGNIAAVTYKSVFPLIQSNKVWLGVTRHGTGSMWFLIPPDAPVKSGQKEVDGKRYQTVGTAAWFTNLDHGRRHEKMILNTAAENIRFGNDIPSTGYSKFDNFDAIEVPKAKAIPSDFKGVMGVPITFLSKYNPDQFEIVGCSYDYGRPEFWDKNVTMSPTIDGKDVYKRLFIRHKRK